MDKVFSPRPGSFPGSFFNAVHRGILPLARQVNLRRLFKVGTLSYNWSTIGLAWADHFRSSRLALFTTIGRSPGGTTLSEPGDS